VAGREILDRFAFAGTPDDLVRQVERIFDPGAAGACYTTRT